MHVQAVFISIQWTIMKTSLWQSCKWTMTLQHSSFCTTLTKAMRMVPWQWCWSVMMITMRCSIQSKVRHLPLRIDDVKRPFYVCKLDQASVLHRNLGQCVAIQSSIECGCQTQQRKQQNYMGLTLVGYWRNQRRRSRLNGCSYPVWIPTREGMHQVWLGTSQYACQTGRWVLLPLNSQCSIICVACWILNKSTIETRDDFPLQWSRLSWKLAQGHWGTRKVGIARYRATSLPRPRIVLLLLSLKEIIVSIWIKLSAIVLISATHGDAFSKATKDFAACAGQTWFLICFACNRLQISPPLSLLVLHMRW